MMRTIVERLLARTKTAALLTAVAGISAGCDRFLDGNDQIEITAVPAVLFIAQPPAGGSAGTATSDMGVHVTTVDSCRTSGGALVMVRGVRSNGTTPGGFNVDLSISIDGTTSDAIIIPLRDSANQSGNMGSELIWTDALGIGSQLSSHLNDQGEALYCVLPRTTKGKVLLLARSGKIEKQTSLLISGNTLPAGSALRATVGPLNTLAVLPDTGSTYNCGTMLTGSSCVPGKAARSYQIALQAAPPSGDSAVLPNAPDVALSVSLGWLSKNSCTSSEPPQMPASLTVSLDSALSASVKWCLSDGGGTGILTASSGTISLSEQKTITVSPVPHAVLLSAARTLVKAGESLSWGATVIGCDGQPIRDAAVSLVSDSDKLAAAGPAATVKTDADGTANFSTTVDATAMAGAKLAAHAELNNARWVQCSASVTISN